MTPPDGPTGPNTTAKARAKQEALKKSKTLILLGQSDQRQRWLLVRLWPAENRRGEFFVTHAGNLPKFDKDPRFLIEAIANDRAQLSALAREMTLQAGPAYQPITSAIHRLPSPTGPEPEDSTPSTTITQPGTKQ